MHPLIKKYGLAIKVFIIVAVIIGVKLLLHNYKIEYVEMTSLFTTMIGGAMFLIGFILAGTMADYKESEKIPSEVAASLENIYQEGEYIKKIKPDFNLKAHHERTLAIINCFEKDLYKPEKHKKSFEAIEGLSASMMEMEKLAVPAGYISRIKTEQGNLNKIFLRTFYIKETSFIPGAYAIAEIITLFVIGFMLLMKVENMVVTLTIFSVIIYLFLYMVFFIKDIDDPFEEGGYADVDMFLVHNIKERLTKAVHAKNHTE
jgi:hypothetical protein